MKWKSKTERRSQELYSTAPTRFNDYLLHAKHCARIPDEHDRGDPSSQSYCIGGGGVGEGKQPSRAWPPGGEVQVLWENHDGVGQGRLPAEVVPKVSP